MQTDYPFAIDHTPVGQQRAPGQQRRGVNWLRGLVAAGLITLLLAGSGMMPLLVGALAILGSDH